MSKGKALRDAHPPVLPWGGGKALGDRLVPSCSCLDGEALEGQTHWIFFGGWGDARLPPPRRGSPRGALRALGGAELSRAVLEAGLAPLTPPCCPPCRSCCPRTWSGSGRSWRRTSTSCGHSLALSRAGPMGRCVPGTPHPHLDQGARGDPPPPPVDPTYLPREIPSQPTPHTPPGEIPSQPTPHTLQGRSHPTPPHPTYPPGAIPPQTTLHTLQGRSHPTNSARAWVLLPSPSPLPSTCHSSSLLSAHTRVRVQVYMCNFPRGLSIWKQRPP